MRADVICRPDSFRIRSREMIQMPRDHRARSEQPTDVEILLYILLSIARQRRFASDIDCPVYAHPRHALT